MSAPKWAAAQDAVRMARQALLTLPTAHRIRALGQLLQEAAGELGDAPVAASVGIRRTSASPTDRRLTMRQQRVYDWIVGYMDVNGLPPTLREIGLGLGIRSTNGVNDHLLALERRGLIVRVESADGGKLNRNIRIVRQDQP